MDKSNYFSGHRPIFHAEFRVMFAIASHDPDRLRTRLRREVLQPLRTLAENRGVLLEAIDPGSTIPTNGKRREEMLAGMIEKIRDYRPIFIGIFDHAAEPPRKEEQQRWMKNIEDESEWDIACTLIEEALSDHLMREHLFLPLLKPGEGEGNHTGEIDPREQQAQRLIDLARERRFQPCRRSASDDELLHHIRSNLKDTFDRAHPPQALDSLYDHHLRMQEQIIEDHCHSYEEPQEPLKALNDYLKEGGSPMFVTGDHGSGKSALLAYWTRSIRTERSGVPVIRHFVGAGSAESDHALVLRHLMTELNEYCAIGEPMPTDTAGLKEAFPLRMAQIRYDPFVIVVDALDQLDPASHELAWLPSHIPPNVRLIVSTIPGPVRARLAERGWRELPMPPFTSMQMKAIIERSLRGSGTPPGPDLLKRFDSGNGPSPLFLLANPHEQMPNNSDEWKHLLSKTTDELFEDRLQRLEETHGVQLVRDTLSFLSCTRRGLGITELAELASSDQEEIASLLADCVHWTRENEGLHTLLNDHVRLAIRSRYLTEAGPSSGIRVRLAQFFASGPVTPRRADEEPWQWMQSGDLDGLAASLSGIPMFMLLSEEHRRHELMEYWVRLNPETMEACYRRSFAELGNAPEHASMHSDVAKRLGLFFMVAGRFSAAKDFLQKALKLRPTLASAPDPIVADIYHDHAELLRQLAEFEGAKESYFMARTIRRQQRELDRPAAARLLNDIGLLYRDWGHPRKALPFYRRAVALREEISGADDPSMAEGLSDLALVYHDLGQFAKAVRLYNRALEIAEHHFGPHHPIVATILNNRGGALLEDGYHEKARESYERALEIRERMLGPDHPHTLITLSNIASLLHILGDLDRARGAFERAIEATERVLGPGHPNAIALNISYAQLLRDCGGLDKAEEVLQRTLGTALRALDPTHPYVAACANNLAGLLRRLKRHTEAIPFYLLAIAAWSASYGPDHDYIGYARQGLRHILANFVARNELRNTLANALAMLEHLLPKGSPILDALRKLIDELNDGDLDSDTPDPGVPVPDLPDPDLPVTGASNQMA